MEDEQRARKERHARLLEQFIQQRMELLTLEDAMLVEARSDLAFIQAQLERAPARPADPAAVPPAPRGAPAPRQGTRPAIQRQEVVAICREAARPLTPAEITRALAARRPELAGTPGLGNRVSAAVAVAYRADEIARRPNEAPGAQGFVYFAPKTER